VKFLMTNHRILSYFSSASWAVPLPAVMALGNTIYLLTCFPFFLRDRDPICLVPHCIGSMEEILGWGRLIHLQMTEWQSSHDPLSQQAPKGLFLGAQEELWGQRPFNTSPIRSHGHIEGK
jgi:hypothetical protein